MPKTKPLKPGRPESVVLQQVIEAAATLGITLARRNTGAALNPKGQMVRFGSPGDSDLYGTLPNGKSIHVEVKAEGFDPSKLRGEKRDHFDRQLSKLQTVNALGGVGFWIEDAAEALTILRHVLAGASIVEPGYGRPEVVYPNVR